MHDLELFRRSRVYLLSGILLVADKGYQGVAKLHSFSVTPFKAGRNRPLTELQRQFNDNLSSYRVRIEHVNRCIKCFKILQCRYRNKQRNHLLYTSLICGIYTYELET